MTIRKGEPWGEAVAVPPDLTVLHDDLAVHRWVVAQRQRAETVRALGLAGGDLARTMAGGGPDQFQSGATRLPLDLVRVEAEGATTWSVAHVVARRSWWRGEVVLAMTAQYLGDADVAPRAHPNDGKVDVLRVDPAMPMQARWQAARRARTGSHLPHPQLRMSQVAQTTVELVRPLVVWVDGIRWLTAGALTLTVEPDAYIAYV
jgi:YegS C-terminal NAD kinase beta sandwich-like domain